MKRPLKHLTAEDHAVLDRWCAMSDEEFDRWVEAVWADAVANNEIKAMYLDLGGEA